MLTPIGQRLTQLRELVGLSARELDRLAGLSFGHTRAIETRVGDRSQLDTIAHLARVLGADPSWVAYGKGEPPTADEAHDAIKRARARALAAEHQRTGTDG